MSDRIGAAVAGIAGLLVAAGVDVGQGDVDQMTQAIVGALGAVGIAYAIGKRWITGLFGKSKE